MFFKERNHRLQERGILTFFSSLLGALTLISALGIIFHQRPRSKYVDALSQALYSLQ